MVASRLRFSVFPRLQKLPDRSSNGRAVRGPAKKAVLDFVVLLLSKLFMRILTVEDFLRSRNSTQPRFRISFRFIIGKEARCADRERVPFPKVARRRA